MATLTTQRGQQIAESYNQSIGPFVTRIATSQLLGRSRSTINFWDKLLLKNSWYRAAKKDVAKRLKRNQGLPFHPFQLALLKEINRFQSRGRCAKRNRDRGEIKAFIERNSELWTLPNWEAGAFGTINL